MNLSNQDYYDQFSKTYENQRHEGYHALLDRLEANIVRPFAKGKKVLEVGCGTGLVMEHLKLDADKLVGIDLSRQMLGKSKERCFQVLQASAVQLPFESNSFDVTYSFKVLAHVKEIEAALSEMTRVTKSGGIVIAEFYNAVSWRYLRWLARRLLSLFKRGVKEHEVYARYETRSQMKRYQPYNLELLNEKGVIIWSPAAFVFKIPVLKQMFDVLETHVNGWWFKYFAGFSILIYRKK